ncbi:hypothetical protein AURDEDRAFT_166727 [Auricularia subglabra TFB-10046 SS5]|nr:hypothetical protein AURDEDRAFT_166727 [Auricularia subglabra TFB-10046 SS5]
MSASLVRPHDVRRDQLRALVRALNMALAEDTPSAYNLVEQSLLDIFGLREIIDGLEAQRILLDIVPVLRLLLAMSVSLGLSHYRATLS